MHAQLFNIGNKVPRRILKRFGVGGRIATATLVKPNDPPFLGMEEAPHVRAHPTARATMQTHNGNALRCASLLKIQRMQITDSQIFDLKRLNLGIEFAADGGRIGHKFPSCRHTT